MFALIAVGAGSIITTGARRFVAIALARGLALGLIAGAAGPMSVAVERSLTIGLMTEGRIAAWSSDRPDRHDGQCPWEHNNG
jgi:hypothetical protein